LQPYRREPAIVQFHASGRAGRRNAVTEEDLLAVAAAVAQFATRTDDDDASTVSVADAVSDNASITETGETRDTQSDDTSTGTVYDAVSDASTVTVYDTVSDHSSGTRTTETRDAGLPADLSKKLKFAGENL